MAESEISLTLRLETATKQDGDQWIAWCVPLDVMSQGDTQEQAVASLKVAVELWFESCIQRGGPSLLDEALREAGFVRFPPNVSIPLKNTVTVSQRRLQPAAHEFTSGFIEVSVPAYFAAHQLETQCATR